jgi:putative SOS response-associated peptidase YedK
MCYSAKVRQDLRELAREFGAEVDWAAMEDLFHRRLDSADPQKPNVRVASGLEWNFSQPQSFLDRRIQADIDRFNAKLAPLLEEKRRAQETRVEKATQLLRTPQALSKTRLAKAQTDVRVGTDKVRAFGERLAQLAAPQKDHNRIFPDDYVPLLVRDGERLVIRPMRYSCRIPRTPPGYPEPFNARRDRLNEVWPSVYGSQHGILVVQSFFEKVDQHRYEHRELRPGEPQTSIELHFQPTPAIDMRVPCVWSQVPRKGEPDLYSFALITDDPPAEVAAAGHDRCPIALKEEYLSEWLAPAGLSHERLQAILLDRQRPYFENRLAA